MDELAARGVSEYSVTFPVRYAGKTQHVEQARNNAVGPLFARIWRAVLVMQIAKMIAQVIRKRFFRKFDGDREQVVSLDQRQPVIAIGCAVSSNAVMHEHQRRPRRVLLWP